MYIVFTDKNGSVPATSERLRSDGRFSHIGETLWPRVIVIVKRERFFCSSGAGVRCGANWDNVGIYADTCEHRQETIEYRCYLVAVICAWILAGSEGTDTRAHVHARRTSLICVHTHDQARHTSHTRAFNKRFSRSSHVTALRRWEAHRKRHVFNAVAVAVVVASNPDADSARTRARNPHLRFMIVAQFVHN